MENNIQMFEDEIAKLKETIIEYKMLAKETEYNGNPNIQQEHPSDGGSPSSDGDNDSGNS